MSGKLSLRVEPRAEELDAITAAVEEFADAERWPFELVYRVNLVLEEVGLNIINHGRTDDLNEIEINLTSKPESLTIEIVDNGRPFNPLKDAPEPDLDSGIADRAVGGLGVHLVRTMMDEMHYRRDGGRNYLTLVKERAK